MPTVVELEQQLTSAVRTAFQSARDGLARKLRVYPHHVTTFLAHFGIALYESAATETSDGESSSAASVVRSESGIVELNPAALAAAKGLVGKRTSLSRYLSVKEGYEPLEHKRRNNSELEFVFAFINALAKVAKQFSWPVIAEKCYTVPQAVLDDSGRAKAAAVQLQGERDELLAELEAAVAAEHSLISTRRAHEDTQAELARAVSDLRTSEAARQQQQLEVAELQQTVAELREALLNAQAQATREEAERAALARANASLQDQVAFLQAQLETLRAQQLEQLAASVAPRPGGVRAVSGPVVSVATAQAQAPRDASPPMSLQELSAATASIHAQLDSLFVGGSSVANGSPLTPFVHLASPAGRRQYDTACKNRVFILASLLDFANEHVEQLVAHDQRVIADLVFNLLTQPSVPISTLTAKFSQANASASLCSFVHTALAAMLGYTEQATVTITARYYSAVAALYSSPCMPSFCVSDSYQAKLQSWLVPLLQQAPSSVPASSDGAAKAMAQQRGPLSGAAALVRQVGADPDLTLATPIRDGGGPPVLTPADALRRGGG